MQVLRTVKNRSKEVLGAQSLDSCCAGGKDELHEELSIRKKGHEIETYDLCTEFVMMIIHENKKRDEL